MKQVSAEYKNQIKEMGREIDSIITYYNHYQIITENNKYILTEDGQKILTEQIKQDSNINITAEDIYSSKVITHGDLLKTMMKEFDFEVKQDMKIGSIVSYKFGLKVNNSYEYVDYGNFIVNKKEYNEDTQTYSYVAYDKMLFTMVPYVAEDISERQGVYTLYGLVSYCCEFCGLQLGIESFPNSEREITDDILKSLESSNFTFRDILDYATEVTGCSSYILDEQFVIMPPNETNLILYADSFKDTNVKFNEVFGPINSILFSRSEDTDVIEIKDDESIEANGVTQIKIKDNPFLEGNDRADYFEEMFDVLDGLTYSLNDVSSTGITYLEFNDKYKVSIDENEYDCLLLNDEINVVQGLEETIFTEEPQEKQQEYVTSTANVDDVSLRVDKANKQIVLKVDSNGNLATAELKQNADNGTAFHVKADDISLEGKTIDLTGETINISSDNFNVDSSGNMTCNGATANNLNVNGGDITLTSTEQISKFVLNDSTSNCNWSQSARRVQWRGVGTGYIEMGNYHSQSCYITLSDNSGGSSSNTTTLYPYNVTSPAFVNTSKEEIKKDFEKIENALDILKSTDIYKYHYKNEEDTDKKHIGVVIGDKYNYSKEITSKDDDGIDTYAMISVLWQAVKEQQKEIEELKERIGN